MFLSSPWKPQKRYASVLLHSKHCFVKAVAAAWTLQTHISIRGNIHLLFANAAILGNIRAVTLLLTFNSTIPRKCKVIDVRARSRSVGLICWSFAQYEMWLFKLFGCAGSVAHCFSISRQERSVMATSCQTKGEEEPAVRGSSHKGTFTSTFHLIINPCHTCHPTNSWTAMRSFVSGNGFSFLFSHHSSTVLWIVVTFL